MAEIKNPRLMLAGAALGAYTQDPENHPIMGLAGVGIGAYVGANLQIVREIPKAKNRADRLGAGVLDYINVNPEEFNATKHATVKESEMERFIRDRVRNSSRANTTMRRHINDRIKASMQNSGIDTSMFKKSFINEMMNSFDGEKFTTGFDKFLRNKSSLGRNVDSALFSERLTSIEKQASGIIKGAQQRYIEMQASYRKAVDANFVALTGNSLSDVLTEDQIKFLLNGKGAVENPQEVIKSIESAKIEKDYIHALKSSTDPENIAIDEKGIFSADIKSIDRTNIKSVESLQRGVLNLTESASRNDKIDSIKKYLVQTLGNTEGEAERIATNLVESNPNASFSISDNNLQIKRQGEKSVSMSLMERKNGRAIERIGGNTYNPIMFNPFGNANGNAKLPNGQRAAAWHFGMGDSAQVSGIIGDSHKLTGYTAAEAASLHSAVTGVPLSEAYDIYNKREFIGASSVVDDLGILPRNSQIDFSNSMTFSKGGIAKGYTDSLTSSGYKKIIEDVDMAARKAGIPSPALAKIRSQNTGINDTSTMNSVAAGISPHPERSSGNLSRTNIATVSDLEIPFKATAEQLDAGLNQKLRSEWVNATEAMAKDGRGVNLRGSIPVTLGTSAGRNSLGSLVYGITVSDGQSATSLKGVNVNFPLSINLGEGDIKGNKRQREIIESLINGGGPVEVSHNDIVAFSGGKPNQVPRYANKMVLTGIEENEGNVRLLGYGVNSVDDHNAVGMKGFGDIKSNMVFQDERTRKAAKILDEMEKLGVLTNNNGAIEFGDDTNLSKEGKRFKKLIQEFKSGRESNKEYLKQYGANNYKKLALDMVDQLENDITKPAYKRTTLTRALSSIGLDKNLPDVVLRRQDSKTVAALEQLYAPVKELNNSKNVSEQTINRVQQSMTNTLDLLINNAEDGKVKESLLNMREQVKVAHESHSPVEALKDISSQARGTLIAERAINDGKSSNIALSTILNNLSEYNKKLKYGVQEEFLFHHGDGNTSKILLGTDAFGNRVRSEDVITQYLEHNTERMKKAANGVPKLGGITSSGFYEAVQNDFTQLYRKLDSKGMAPKIWGLVTFQSGNEAITGANASKGTISWMAQDAMSMNGMSKESIASMTSSNNDAIYTFKSRLAQRYEAQGINQAFSNDVDVAKGQINKLFNPDTARKEYVEKYLTNAKVDNGVMTISLDNEALKNIKGNYSKFKSLSIELLDTDLSGSVTMEDGKPVNRQIDKLKRNVLISQLDLQQARKSGHQETIRLAEEAYRDSFKKWADMEIATDKNVVKEAIKREFNQGATVTAVETTGYEEAIRIRDSKANKNAVFINDETYRALGFNNGDYSLIDEGNGIQKIVFKHDKSKAAVGFSVREPASGPLSSMAGEFYLNTQRDRSGLILGIGTKQLAAQSGDYDGDKLVLGILKKNAQKFDDIHKEISNIGSMQAEVFNKYGEFIEGINLKMAEASKEAKAVNIVPSMKNIPEDMPAALVEKIAKGSRRDFDAPAITSLQQLITNSLVTEHERNIATLMLNEKMDAIAKAGAIKNSQMEMMLAFEASRSIQEDTLKSVRKSSTGAAVHDTLLDLTSRIKEGWGKNPDADFTELGNTIKGFMHEMYGKHFTSDEGKQLLDNVSETIKTAIINHGPGINANPANMVGDLHTASDKLTAGATRLSGISDKALEDIQAGPEQLQRVLESNIISETDDGLKSMVSTLKKNKHSLILGAAGLGVLAFIGGAESPNMSSPMYNSPVARTNPTLPPLTSESAYIQKWGADGQSVTINGQQINNYSESRIKQNMRSMFQGDTNSRNTVRFDNRNY